MFGSYRCLEGCWSGALLTPRMWEWRCFFRLDAGSAELDLTQPAGGFEIDPRVETRADLYWLTQTADVGVKERGGATH